MDCGDITVLVFKSLLFYLMMTPKRKSSNNGISDILKRRCKVLPLSKKLKVLNFIRRKNQRYAVIASFYGKNKFTCEIVKNEKELQTSLTVVPRHRKITTTVHEWCLIEIEKALHLCICGWKTLSETCS